MIGVAQALLRAGSTLAGANLLIEGDVPQGAGLSSSASLEVAVGYALLDLAGDAIDLTKLALLCQKARTSLWGRAAESWISLFPAMGKAAMPCCWTAARSNIGCCRSGAKYFSALDRNTQARIRKKLEAIAAEPQAARLSKPLVGADSRTARVGDYRIVFTIDPQVLYVADIGPRGQIYRRLQR